MTDTKIDFARRTLAFFANLQRGVESFSSKRVGISRIASARAPKTPKHAPK